MCTALLKIKTKVLNLFFYNHRWETQIRNEVSELHRKSWQVKTKKPPLKKVRNTFCFKGPTRTFVSLCPNPSKSQPCRQKNFRAANLRFLEADPVKMDVFLMIRRHKTTVFLDAKENTSVLELKRMIEGITKKPPAEQRLYNKDDVVSSIFCSPFFLF